MREKIEDLLVDWEIARQDGKPVSADELCKDCPELLDELRHEIKRLNSTSWLFDNGFVGESARDETTLRQPCGFLESLRVNQLLTTQQLAKIENQLAQESVLNVANSLVDAKVLTQYQADVVAGKQQGPLKIDRYRILEQIGCGGMGDVYRAQHVSMKRDVAIKVLRSHVQFSEERRERFVREIEAIARLDHPNIVTAYDASQSDGWFYLVMEYVPGPNLAEQVAKSGPLQPAAAIDVIRQVADAAHFAHGHGIIHRDIKPANVLLSPNGNAKLLDLGIAKMTALGEGTHCEFSPTETGAMFGTVAYMSPEHATDPSGIDARADVYSLGCTLFFLLCGSPPYEDDNPINIVLQHREKSVKETLSQPEVTDAIRPILAKMLAKDVAERFQSMKEVGTALNTLDIEDLSSSNLSVAQAVASSKPRKRSPRLAKLALTFLAVSIVGIGVWGLQRMWTLDPSTIKVHSVPDWGSKSYQNDLARWLTNNGGSVTAQTEFSLEEIYDSSQVPVGPIEIHSIQVGPLTEEFSFEWLVKVKSLRHLSIHNSQFFESDIPFLRRLEQLETLEIRDCEFVPGFWGAISELKQLSGLAVDSFDDVPLVVACVCKLDQLESLELSNAEFDDKDAAMILSEVDPLNMDFAGTLVTVGTLKRSLSSPQIQTLNLSDNRISDEDFAELKVSHSLQTLNLGNCSVGSEMAKYATRLPRLRELILEATEIGGREIGILANCRQLEFLNVTQTRVGNASLAKLASYSNLHSLSLGGLPIVDGDLVILQSMDLEYLDLTSTKITDDAFASLSRFSSLSYLDLTDCQLSDSAIEEFADAHAHIEVVQYVTE